METVFWAQLLSFAILLVLSSFSLKFYLPRFKKHFYGEDVWKPQPVTKWDLYFAGILVLYASANIVALFQAPPEEPPVIEISTFQTSALIMFLLIGGIFAILKTSHRSPVEFFGLELRRIIPLTPNAFFCLLAAYPLILLAFNLLTFFLDTNPEENAQPIIQFFLNTDDWAARAWVVISAVIIAPLAEEIIFRGYLFNITKNFIGATGAMFFTSVLFALIHAHAMSLIPLLLLSLCLTIAYQSTRSLWTPILIHGMFNSTTILLLASGV